MTETNSTNSLPTINEIFLSRRTGYCYELKSIISEGGFGTVFKGYCITKHSKVLVALKIEKCDKSLQNFEISVLKAAKKNNCKQFPELIDYGTVTDKFNFITMTLLGKDLYHLRKEQPNSRFTLSTAIRIGYQTMKAIEELHMKCFFICRDIKPSNFVIGLINSSTSKVNQIYMIDFGLCRRYVDRNEKIIPSRGEVGWRGTSRYASIQCHKKMDLSRKDDIESWFYMLVEGTKGFIPWQSQRVIARDIVYVSKLNARTLAFNEFLKNCPNEYENILHKIDLMKFEDTPDYQYFYQMLSQICLKHNINKNDPYDWETVAKIHRTTEVLKINQQKFIRIPLHTAADIAND